MKKMLIISSIIIILLILGFAYYMISSPLTINSVKIPESIGTYTQDNIQNINGYSITGELNSFIKKCKLVSYNPDSSLNSVLICKPGTNPIDAVNSWVSKDMNFFNGGNQKFSRGETEINGVDVITLTLAKENCGNPGFCTAYYWKQGRIIFNSNTRQLVENYIEVN